MTFGDTAPRSGGRRPKSPEELSDQIEALRAELQTLTSPVTDVAGKQLTRAQESLEQSIRSNPIAAVGIAAAIGFFYALIRR